MTKILCLGALVTQALLMGVQDYIVEGDGEFAAWSEIDYLGYIAQLAELLAFRETFGYGKGDLFAHAVGYHVGTRFTQNAGTQTVAPVVIMGHATQRCLYSAQYDGHIRK